MPNPTQRSINEYVKQQSLNALRKSGQDLAKGAAVGPFTAAPDILGLGQQGFNALQSGVSKQIYGKDYSIPMGVMSGDPIRRSVGLDPQSTAGMAGEFIDPTNALAKGAKVAKVLPDLLRATDIPNALAMTLFHGTPHKFSKFELDKIGTGEGAQAFGHGLYFAENPGVARSYQRQLSDYGVNLDGKYIDIWDDDYGADQIRKGLANRNFEVDRAAKRATNQSGSWTVMYEDDGAELIYGALRENAGDPKKAAKWLRDKAVNESDRLTATYIPRANADAAASQYAKAADLLESSNFKRVEGHLYEVEIPDEITNKMLDWDKPLSEQPESVRALIAKADEDELTGWVNWFNREEYAPNGWESLTDRQQKVFARSLEKDGVQLPLTLENKYSPSRAPEQTGEDFYRHFSEDPEEASELLKQAGIPGIRFLDQQSRGAQEGTRNIVVFDPDDIKQVKRDGETVYNALTKK